MPQPVCGAVALRRLTDARKYSYTPEVPRTDYSRIIHTENWLTLNNTETQGNGREGSKSKTEL